MAEPGEEKTFAFSFMIPEDIETKDYFAIIPSPCPFPFRRGAFKGQVKYKSRG